MGLLMTDFDADAVREQMAREKGHALDDFADSFNGDEAGDIEYAFALDRSIGLVMRGGNDLRAVFEKAYSALTPRVVRAVTDSVRSAHVKHRDTHRDENRINGGWSCCGLVQLHVTFPEACAVCGDAVWPCAWIEWADEIDKAAGVQRDE